MPHRRSGGTWTAAGGAAAAIGALVVMTAGPVSAGAPVASGSSNCLGSDAWVATMVINSDDPTGAWRLDAPVSQPGGGSYQPEANGFVVERTVPLDQASATVSATVSWDGGAAGQALTIVVDRPTECVAVAPPPAPPAAATPDAAAPDAAAPDAAAPDVTAPDAAARVPAAGGAAPDLPAAPAPPSAPAAAAPSPQAVASAPSSAAPAQQLPATGDETGLLALIAVFLTSTGLLLHRLGRTNP